MIKLITTTGSGAPVQAATTANARLVSSANRRMDPILSRSSLTVARLRCVALRAQYLDRR